MHCQAHAKINVGIWTVFGSKFAVLRRFRYNRIRGKKEKARNKTEEKSAENPHVYRSVRSRETMSELGERMVRCIL